MIYTLRQEVKALVDDMTQTWQKRCRDYWNEALRYFRLIGNSGFMFALVVAFIAGAYYYGQFLDWMPQDFPVVSIFAVVSTFLLVRSPVRTFLKQPDLVFLLPLEAKMTSYFRKSVWYSFALQSGTLLVVMIMMLPLFHARITDNNLLFILCFIGLLIAKYWNVTASWYDMYIQDTARRLLSLGMRVLISFAFTWLLFVDWPLWLVILPLIAMAALQLLYYRKLPLHHTLKWERLLAVEEKRLFAFYRVAHLFTEVPRLKNRVRRRRWADLLANRLSYAHKNVFTALFLKTFFRADDYFGTYGRLLLIGSLLLWAIPVGYGTWLIALLMLYLTGTQLYTLWFHPSAGMWDQLYPVSNREIKASLQKIVFVLLAIEAAFMGFGVWLGSMNVLISLVICVFGWFVAGLFAYGYIGRKLN